MALEADFDVGARLSAVRKMHHMSQRELAKRCGVTHSSLSLIEQGKVSPSVSSLSKILAAIPMSVGDFFTMGDVGYFDEDDYLFLTGRSAETIISGGVNIYPQEIDNELIKHPAVADSSTAGYSLLEAFCVSIICPD